MGGAGFCDTHHLHAPMMGIANVVAKLGSIDSCIHHSMGKPLNALKYDYQNGYFQSAQYNLNTIWNTAERFPDQQVKLAGMAGGLTIARTYDAVGRIATIRTTLSNNAGVTTPQNATFGFDTLGNLTSRTDSSASPNLSENFCYDVLNRVKGSIGSCNTFVYDGAGNLNSKSGVSLAYTGGTNRLSTVDGQTVAYDAGGNVKNDGTRSYSYTPYDVPDKISMGSQWMEFGFTGNGQCAYERDGAGGAASGITYFAGPDFFEQDNTIANGVATVSEVREFLATPASTIGVVVTNSTGSNMSLYLQDHLGSNVASVNATTGIVARNSYDVWGVRSGAALDKGNRGYTGHEHLDFGLIHMNGRVYDPRWGRFLQADPIIQSPYDLQNYNRYSYVMNNPLSFTDPTGFSRWTNFRDRYGKMIVGAVVSYFTFGAAYGWAMGEMVSAYGGAMSITCAQFATAQIASGAFAGAAAGFAAGGTQGGNIQSATSGAVSGALFGVAGQAFSAGTVESYAAHAAAGCASRSATGGSCSSGAAGALAGKLVTNISVAALGQSPSAHFTATVIGGGAGAKAAGGSFENGAYSAAMGYILNFLAPKRNNPNRERQGEDKLYAIDFEKGAPDLDPASKWVVGRAPWAKLMMMGEAISESFTCAAAEECYGYRDLTGAKSDKANSIEPQLKSLATAYATKNNIDLQYMSRSTLNSIVELWGGVEGFNYAYGSTEKIMSHFKPTPAPRPPKYDF